MALSDQGINVLIEKAESHCVFRATETERSQTGFHLEYALRIYNQIIETNPAHAPLFIRRAEIKHQLALRSRFYTLNGAIEDITRAIELDQNNATYYRIRGEYLSLTLSERQQATTLKEQLAESILKDYKLSQAFDPSEPEIWLDLLEYYLLVHEWDIAIGIYGDCSSYMHNKRDKLTRSWLGCLALAFAGDPIEEEDKEYLVRWEPVNLFQSDEELKEKIIKEEKEHKDRNARQYLNDIDKQVFAHLIMLRVTKIASLFNDVKGRSDLVERLKKAAEIDKLFSRFYRITRTYEVSSDLDHTRFTSQPYATNYLFKYLANDVMPVSYFVFRRLISPYYQNIQNKSLRFKFFSDHSVIDLFLDAKHEISNIFENQAYSLDFYLNQEEYLYDGKRKTFERYLKEDCSAIVSPEFWYNKSFIETELFRFEEAIASIDKFMSASIDNNMNQSIGIFCKAFLLRRVNRDKALEVYDQAVNTNIDDIFLSALAYFEKGRLLEEKRASLEDSLVCCERAISLRPDFIEAWLNKVMVLVELRRYDEALSAIGNVFGVRPDISYFSPTVNIGLLIAKMFIYTKFEQNDNALETIETILGLLEADAYTYDIFRWAVKLDRAMFLGKMGRSDKAFEIIKKEIPRFEKNIDMEIHDGTTVNRESLAILSYYKALIYQTINLNNEALEAYDQSISVITNIKDFNFSKVYYHYLFLIKLISEIVDVKLKVHNIAEVTDFLDEIHKKAIRWVQSILEYEIEDKLLEIFGTKHYLQFYYTKACIYAEIKKDKINALLWLQKMIKEADGLKEFVKEDRAFKDLWDDEDFKRIVA